MKARLDLFKSLILSLSLAWAAFFVSPAVAGTKDGGGGAFTIATFWEIVKTEIVPALKNLDQDKQKILSSEQVSKLLEYMQPKKTQVEMKLEQIYITKNGKKIPVDAANYPSASLIELYQPSWQYQINSGMDIKHLILHEFMGVTKISDLDHVSSKIFPPRRLPIPFYAQKIVCESAVKYIRIKENNWYINDTPPIDPITFTLSKETRLNKNPKCVETDKETLTCIKYANDYWVKKAEVRIPIILGQNDNAGGTYYIEASINVLSSYYGYGWGAAMNTLFLRNPLMQIIWKLIYIENNRDRKTLTILTQEKYETDEFSNKTSLVESIPVPAFIETLNRNGFQLSAAPYKGEVTSLFHSYNIAGFLNETAISNGYNQRKEIDNYVVHKILKGMKGNSLPFRIDVSCTLKPD